jgi:hypothetical protein
VGPAPDVVRTWADIPYRDSPSKLQIQQVIEAIVKVDASLKL